MELDLDGNKNNESKDLTSKFIEKEIEKANKRQSFINSFKKPSSAEIALKAAQLEATTKDTAFKELKEKMLQDRQEELYNSSSIIKPMKFVPAKKTNNPQTVNNINTTHASSVLLEQKKWYERPLGILWISIVASLLAGLLFYTYFPS